MPFAPAGSETRKGKVGQASCLSLKAFIREQATAPEPN
jgi:hypothetical protein